MYHRIINFSCYLSYYPATYDVNPNVFSLLLYFPDHLILVEQWTSAAKIQNSNLLFISYVFIYSWHSHYFTVHPTFFTFARFVWYIHIYCWTLALSTPSLINMVQHYGMWSILIFRVCSRFSLTLIIFSWTWYTSCCIPYFS